MAGVFRTCGSNGTENGNGAGGNNVNGGGVVASSDPSPIDSELQAMTNGFQPSLLSPVHHGYTTTGCGGRQPPAYDPVRTVRRTSINLLPVSYPGDDEDHSKRALSRDALSPSPRQDERRRAEQQTNEALDELADCYRNILVGVGEDPYRQGLRHTPERAARAMLYFTKGYDEKIEGLLPFVGCTQRSRSLVRIKYLAI